MLNWRLYICRYILQFLNLRLSNIYTTTQWDGFNWQSLLNPSNAEASSVQSTRMQTSRRFSKILSNAKNFWKPSKPCHVGIHWKALAEYFQLSTHLPGFQSFSGFLHHFVLAKLATSSMRVNTWHVHLVPFAVNCVLQHAWIVILYKNIYTGLQINNRMVKKSMQVLIALNSVMVCSDEIDQSRWSWFKNSEMNKKLCLIYINLFPLSITLLMCMAHSIILGCSILLELYYFSPF